MKTSLASQIIQKLEEKRSYTRHGCVKQIHSYKRPGDGCYTPTNIRGRPSVHKCNRKGGERFSYTTGKCYKTTTRQAKSEID